MFPNESSSEDQENTLTVKGDMPLHAKEKHIIDGNSPMPEIDKEYCTIELDNNMPKTLEGVIKAMWCDKNSRKEAPFLIKKIKTMLNSKQLDQAQAVINRKYEATRSAYTQRRSGLNIRDRINITNLFGDKSNSSKHETFIVEKEKQHANFEAVENDNVKEVYRNSQHQGW